MAPNNNKRRASQASEETPQQNKKNKVARESTPATVGQSNPAASPTRGKNSQVNQTVIWVRDPPADTIPIKDIPWLQDNIMDLFTQVKNAKDFLVAGSVFWLHYFLYQRGESSERREAIFSTYVRPKLSASLSLDEIPEIWDRLHNLHLAEWAQQLHLLATDWIDSSAGSAFRRDLARSRSSGKARPILSVDGIHEYVSTSDKETYKGIDISLKQVLNVIWRVTHLARTVEVKEVELQDPNSEDPIYWFADDMEALIAEKTARGAKGNDPGLRSWYSRLCGVVLTLVHQFILMNLGYQTRGGKTDEYDGSADFPPRMISENIANFDNTNVAKLLMRVPTLADIKQYNDHTTFRVYDHNLEQWNDHFFDSGIMDLKQPVLDVLRTTTDDDKYDQSLQAAYDKICDGDVNKYMSDRDLTEGVEFGLHRSMELEDQVETMLESVVPKETYFGRDFLPAHLYPPAEIHNPQWTPWLAALASTNLDGQLMLIYSRVEAFQSACRVVALSYQRRAEELEQDKQHLLAEATKVRDAMAVLKHSVSRAPQVKQEINKLRSEIDEGKRNPSVAQYLDLQRSRPIRTSSPLMKYVESNPRADSPPISPQLTADQSKDPAEPRTNLSADRHLSIEPSAGTDITSGQIVQRPPIWQYAMEKTLMRSDDDLRNMTYDDLLTADQDEDVQGTNGKGANDEGGE